MQDGLRVRKTIYMQKIKEEKLGHGLHLAQEENITVFVWTKYKYPKLFKSIGIGYWREKELRDISKDVLFLKIDNARYHWSIEALEFYYENNIKIIDWPSYSPALNQIENIWAIMKKKIAGKFLQ